MFEGMPYIARKIANNTRPNLEIAKNEDEWSITVSTLLRTTVSKFKLGEEYEENMPGGILKVSKDWIYIMNYFLGTD